MATIELSDKVVNLVKSFEGFSSKPKWDYTGYAIGYGNHYDEDSNPITKNHPVITEVEGDKIMRAAMNRVAQKVAKAVDITKLTQYQFEALVSFKYNCYSCIFEDSQLAILIKNDPLDSKIKQFFLSHCNDAHGNYLSGLANRRAIEYKFYETGVVDKNTKATEYGNISQESDVNSNDSKVQVRYVNTNYCNGITCTNYVSTSKPVGTTTGVSNKTKPIDTFYREPQNVYNADAIHLLCVLFYGVRGTDRKFDYKLGSWSSNTPDNARNIGYKCNLESKSSIIGTVYISINSRSYGVKVETSAFDSEKFKSKYFSWGDTNGNNSIINTPYDKLNDRLTEISNNKTIDILTTPSMPGSFQYTYQLRLQLELTLEEEYGKNMNVDYETPLDELHGLMLAKVRSKLKSNDIIGKFEAILNYQPSVNNSMFDLIYKNADKEDKYKKINRIAEYDGISEASGGGDKFTIEGIMKKRPNKTVYWFLNIPDLYKKFFYNKKSCLLTILPNGEYTIFGIYSDSRGNSGGWDNIHMVNCTNKV